MALRGGIKRGAGSLAAVPIIIGIVIVVNLLALAFFVRFDVTDNSIYSLSAASKAVARDIDDRVVVKLYFTRDLPPPYNAHARYLKDQLYEYRAFSGGRLQFEFIDPIAEEREEEAQRAGVFPVQVNAYEKDKIELKKVYMGVVFLYEDKKEVIPIVQSTRNLEYEISSAITKITSDKLPRIAILQGHGEASAQDQLQVGIQALGKLYQASPFALRPGSMIPDGISTLLICGPTDSISRWDQYAIDQFIMHGGKVAVFYDPVQVDIANQSAVPQTSNWPEFLKHYGIRFKDGLVLDTRNSRIAVMQQQGFIRFQNIVDFPFLPQAFAFNQDLLIGKDLQGVDFPFVSPFDSTLADSMGCATQSICWSSEMSGVRRPPYYLSPMQEFKREEFQEPFQILGSTIQCAFNSAFPDGPPADSGVDLASLPAHKAKGDPSRLVAVGDAEFCLDQQITRNPANAAIFQNIVDWLTQEEGLITIRSRDVVSRPLDTVSDGGKQAIKYANIFGPPLLVVALGLIRWQARRRAKRG
ncbi:MAG: GldG family protein [Candidatus Zixiibacteriota bacterium]